MFSSLALSLALAPAASADAIALSTADGQRLHADYKSSAGSTRGVIFVHMEKRKATDWRFLAERLHGSGFHTLAVDLRGHGESTTNGSYAEFGEDDWLAMTSDVQAAVAYLNAAGVTELCLVGASLGANLSLQVAARDPQISNLVLLSPGLNVMGIATEEAMGAYGERPVLIAVSEDDRYYAKSALVLDAEARGDHLLELLKGAGHGSKMLNSAPALEPLVQSWVMGTYHLVSGENVILQVESGDTTSVETDGELLDAHK